MIVTALTVGALFAVLAGGFVLAVASTPDPARIDPTDWRYADPECEHRWKYHDARDVFVCTRCGLVEAAE